MPLTPEQQHTFRLNLVAKAKSHAGSPDWFEQPKYSNRGPNVDACHTFAGNDPATEPPWCLEHAVYCAGTVATEMGLHFSDTDLLLSGYCPAEYNHAKARGTAVAAADVVSGAASVRPGDVVLEWHLSPHGWHHAGIVIIPPSKGSPAFVTVEGNTIADGEHAPPGREREGYGVFQKSRNAADTVSGHPKWCFIRLFKE